MRTKEVKIVENLRVEGPAAKGRCVAKRDEKVYFIEKVAPGDIVDVRPTKRRKGIVEATPVKWHREGPNRQPAFCAHYESCGGCKWQHITYDGQLHMKQEVVEQTLSRLSKVELPEVQPILASPQSEYYRNKLEFTFSAQRWLDKADIDRQEELDRRALGFHVPGRWDRVVDVDHCHLMGGPTNDIRNGLREFARQQGLSFYHAYQQEGQLRNLIIRTTEQGQTMVIVQFGADDPQAVAKVVDYLKGAFPQITTLYTVINTKANETFFDLPLQLHWGPAELTEQLENLHFRLGPKSFFQTNAKQALRMYQQVRDLAGLTSTERVYDLYTGTGTIALFLAKHAREVVGVEIVPEAIEDAKRNATDNGIDNVRFFAADLSKALSEEFMEREGVPDVVVADPPRAGMNPGVVDALLRALPKKIVYVSCNPATQARDLSELSEAYRVTHVQPLDMFPHTEHIENIAVLELKA